MYHKEKLGMTESIYDLCLFYKSGPLKILGIQTNDTLIQANNDFASNKKEAIKAGKTNDKRLQIFYLCIANQIQPGTNQT